MSNIIVQSSSELLPLPVLPIAVRPATLADLNFMDGLQKLHTKMVGWMPTATLEGKIKQGHVLVAEGPGERGEGKENARSELAPCHLPLVPVPLGYCIATDQYFKHDDVGIIYQLNVVPGRQRGLIGASLLKAQFERSAYGCKLYCCWCAQDIAANHFWEAMGFVPLAFRAGSEKRSRIHIFWQKRIRQGDVSTPWWFPSKTDAGAIREDRIVLPIPPGVRWGDEMPRVLPALSGVEGPGERHEGTACLEQLRREARRHEGAERGDPKQIQRTKSEGSKRKPAAPGPKKPVSLAMSVPMFRKPAAANELPVKSQRVKKPRLKAKHDPKLIAVARELRDRWLEEVNAGRYLPESAGKYEVGRGRTFAEPNRAGLLDAA